MQPHKPEMRENNHEKLMVTPFGQRHSTFYPCTQIAPTPRRGLTVTQDMYPHSYKRLRNLTISVSDSTLDNYNIDGDNYSQITRGCSLNPPTLSAEVANECSAMREVKLSLVLDPLQVRSKRKRRGSV